MSAEGRRGSGNPASPLVGQEQFLEASANPWLGRLATQTHNIPCASDRIVLWDVAHAVPLRSHGNHLRIVEALIERDSARAEQLMREHVDYAGVILKNNYQRLLDSGETAVIQAASL